MSFDLYYFLWHITFSTVFFLCVVVGIIGYFSKDLSFKYYAVYALFLCLYLFMKQPFENELINSIYGSSWKILNWYFQVIYNCIYFIFFIKFLSLREHLGKFSKFIDRFVLVAFSSASLIFILSLVFEKPEIFDKFYVYIFTPILFLMAIFTLLKVLSIPGKLKRFIIFGNAVYISLALIALILSISYKSSGYQGLAITPLSYFLIGILIEQFALGLGLAYRVKLINKSYISQLRENQKMKFKQEKVLRDTLATKEKELLTLTKKNEEAKIKRIKQDYEIQLNKLKLESLQSQMNPHFIFNALNSIKFFLIENDKLKAIYYLNKFSKLIRTILESSINSEKTLSEELDFIDLYIKIENIRLEHEIDFKISSAKDIDLNQIKIPSLILQPFAENAIWHGLSNDKILQKTLKIDVYKKEECVCLNIEDNGIGRKAAEENKNKHLKNKKSIAIENVSKRLKHFNTKHNFNYTFETIDLYNSEQKACGTRVFFEFRK
ncbi:MAG: sensor histidine kinase [Psychroflexus sp.]